MVIDRIGVNAPVNPYGLDRNAVPQVPLNAYEVAWYNWSAEPGTGSNAVFAGHVTWSGNAVFYHLDTLAAGDQVRLLGPNGSQLVYTVTDSYMVDPNDPSALSVMAPTAQDVITIITCDGEFFYTGDPVFRGDYTNRRVVRASFTSYAPAPAALAIP
jgi:LPXTG-site transpeptidase (sortase) family protein